MRTSFLSQLVTETSNLVNYSEVIATDKTKSNIQWTDFLDWFAADFGYQINNTNKVEYITIEANKFEKVIIGGMILLVIMLGLMMLLLLRRDSKTNPTTVVAPVKDQEVHKAPTKTETPAKKDTVSKAVKEDTPKKKTTTETK